MNVLPHPLTRVQRVCPSSLDLAEFASRLVLGPTMGFDVELPPHPGGHRDEATALLADPEPTGAELAEALAAIDDDRATQQADDVAAAELRQAAGEARRRFGVSVRLKLSRWLAVDTQAAAAEASYCAQIVSGDAVQIDPAWILMGMGCSPAASLDDLTAQVDRRLVAEFGGYRVPGVALIVGGHFRGKADALDHARRIALDPSYLDVLLEYATPGVVDHRPGKPGAPAVAAAIAAAA